MQRFVVSTDWHVPGHNKHLLTAFINYLKRNKNNIDGFILGGDFLDSESISSFTLGQNFLNTLGEEYEQGSKILDQFDKALNPNVEKHYLFGNHEARFFKKMNNHEMSKISDVIKDIPEGLRLFERGYSVYDQWMEDEIKIGDYSIIHGLYINKYPAAKHIEMFQANLLFGHSHRINSHYGMGYYAINYGWCGDAQNQLFNYMPRAQKNLWRNAFVTMDVVDGKSYPSLHLWDTVNERFVINGKIYK